MQQPDEHLRVYSQMNERDTARCQQAIIMANAGDKQQAYQIFCDLQRDNPEDTTVLTWIAFTTPRLDEAQRAIRDIERLEPGHPNLGMLRERVGKMRPPVQPQPRYVSSSRMVMTCPYCGYTGPDQVKSRVSTGGWITFVVVLLLFFPLCWIGLLIRKDYSVCGRCGITLGDIMW